MVVTNITIKADVVFVAEPFQDRRAEKFKANERRCNRASIGGGDKQTGEHEPHR